MSLIFGSAAYAEAHRLWGHNLLAASLGGAAVGTAGYLCSLSARVRNRARALLGRLEPRWKEPGIVPVAFSGYALAAWVLLGVLAGLSHLPADVVYGGAPGQPSWPLRPLWPFSQRGWGTAVIAWGDLGATFIFLAEMFALYRWPGGARLVAVAGLLAVVGYIALRAALKG
jgi:hypothetical protein